MDTSPEYIEMCQKAKEIQQKWKPQDWDWVNGARNGARDNYILSGYETDGGYYGPYLTYSLTGDRAEIEGIDDPFWLPRQDQLQAMIFSEIGLQTLCQAICDFSKTEYGSRFTICGSMEQLWLAFTMKEKFGKVWNGKDWNLEKSA